MNESAFCIYVDTICQGPIPAWRDDRGNPVVYRTVTEAQREIIEYLSERLHAFLAGDVGFEDAITVEDYIVKVEVCPDGSITDGDGNRFGANNW
jgi:hypothetical protein